MDKNELKSIARSYLQEIGRPDLIGTIYEKNIMKRFQQAFKGKKPDNWEKFTLTEMESFIKHLDFSEKFILE